MNTLDRFNGAFPDPFEALDPPMTRAQASIYIQERVNTLLGKKFSPAAKASDAGALAEMLGLPKNAFDVGAEEAETDALGSVGNEPKAFEATCAHCGKKITVPAKPVAGKSYYCRDCHNQFVEADQSSLKAAAASDGIRIRTVNGKTSIAVAGWGSGRLGKVAKDDEPLIDSLGF